MTRNFWKFFGQAVGSITSIISMHAFFTSTSWNEILRLFGISTIGIFGLFMLSGFIIDSCKFANERYKKKQKEREREERINELLDTLPFGPLILLKAASETKFLTFEKNHLPQENSWIHYGGSQPLVYPTFDAEGDLNALLAHRLIYATYKTTLPTTSIIKYNLTGLGVLCTEFLDDYLDVPEIDEQPQDESNNSDNSTNNKVSLES
ncbi:MAG: hypothetical protein IJO46_04665 [Thermoguttaceae bacterium]|nr:hypothetical protein [Thermoguttaceae bacterium]